MQTTRLSYDYSVVPQKTSRFEKFPNQLVGRGRRSPKVEASLTYSNERGAKCVDHVAVGKGVAGRSDAHPCFLVAPCEDKGVARRQHVQNLTKDRLLLHACYKAPVFWPLDQNTPIIFSTRPYVSTVGVFELPLSLVEGGE